MGKREDGLKGKNKNPCVSHMTLTNFCIAPDMPSSKQSIVMLPCYPRVPFELVVIVQEGAKVRVSIGWSNWILWAG